MIPIPLDGQVVTGLGQSLEHRFHIADVDIRFGDRKPDFGNRRFHPQHSFV
jgi:hypothetical protein